MSKEQTISSLANLKEMFYNHMYYYVHTKRHIIPMNSVNPMWLDKPYYSLNAFFKHTYGEKCYKIALDGGFTCPNRDGSLGTRGCIFCSGHGSGDFSTPVHSRDSLRAQINAGLSLMGGKQTGSKYVAYFQAYTNTYGPIQRLRALYSEALDSEDVTGISIATRPDCLGTDVVLLLEELKTQYPNKFIWVELGLQTIHETTAAYIRRGYPLAVFDKAVQDLHAIHIPCIVHIILGLPGETPDMLLQTIEHVNSVRPFGIKLQLLHILKGTDLASDYLEGKFQALTMDEYFHLLSLCIAHLSPDIVLHRVTGDGPKHLLIAPLWSGNKRGVLNSLHRYLQEHHIYQGKDFHEPGTIDTL